MLASGSQPRSADVVPHAPALVEVNGSGIARSLDRLLADAAPAAIVAEALDVVGRARLAVVSSFGTEAAALLKIVADVDPAIPVLLLDTGWLFPETLAYRDKLIETLKLTDVRTIQPDPKAVAARDPNSDLWASDGEACCRLRKVEPLQRALQPLSAWINGRKRYHGGERARLPVVEADGDRLKFNPLARASAADIAALFAAANLPRHPLAAMFPSIGCLPCTERARPDEPPRAGRWRGTGRTECGIHAVRS